MKSFLRKLWVMLGGACSHEPLTWVFRDQEGYYRRCNLCGQRLAYSGVELEGRKA